MFLSYVQVYNIPDALNPEAPINASIFLNGGYRLNSSSAGQQPSFCIDPRTRAAIHAPTSKDWVESINYPFGNSKSPHTLCYGILIVALFRRLHRWRPQC